MVWDEQQNTQYPTPTASTGEPLQQGLPGGGGSIAMPQQQTAATSEAPVYYGGNPLQASAAPAGAMPPAQPAAPAPAQLQAPPFGQPQFQAPQNPLPAATMDDSDQVPSDDVVWVNRAKRAIAETRGDPHRKVQLLQHLRSVYLKQRFGRTVHTDEA